ncbi:EamA family transporter [Streptomyces sp. V3I7]|uniref:EamA family transporter n=1 Tax=Streptomyces sp. V3I7 TaxID=3042278 RepID=UPI00277F4E5B|nr:EamA family transporter [Streptomyces sp. V3I7]MDQ0992844.1 O-acetylserine/cysteine efflux transporter [Streptomyces sp. V3I7]
MPRRHMFLGLLVVFIWGTNFVVIDVGLDSFPPLLFAALRFTFVALPAVFFVGRPGAPWKLVALVGILQGAGQFGLLFVGMNLGVPPGLASLVLQGQAAFTVLFAFLVLRERPGPIVAAGVLAGVAGLTVIALGTGSVSLGALLVVVAAGACWAAANITTRIAKPENGFKLTIWSALAAPVPLTLLSLVFEGPERDRAALASLDWQGVGALAFTVVLSTIVAFGIWASLLRSNTASSVSAFSLLVPVVGMATAWLALGEVPTTADWIGGALILGGVVAVIRPDAFKAPGRITGDRPTANQGPDAASSDRTDTTPKAASAAPAGETKKG